MLWTHESSDQVKKIIPIIYGSNTSKAINGCPRCVVLCLSQLKRYIAKPKDSTPLTPRIRSDQTGAKSTVIL